METFAKVPKEDKRRYLLLECCEMYVWLRFCIFLATYGQLEKQRRCLLKMIIGKKDKVPKNDNGSKNMAIWTGSNPAYFMPCPRPGLQMFLGLMTYLISHLCYPCKRSLHWFLVLLPVALANCPWVPCDWCWNVRHCEAFLSPGSQLVLFPCLVSPNHHSVLKMKPPNKRLNECFITWLTFSLCCRYVMAAQALIGDARGTLNDKGWRRTNGELASYDDISAFVIPISECSSEMAKFTVEYDKPTLKPTHSIDNEEDWAVKYEQKKF